MKDKKDELTPEQLEKIAGGVSSRHSMSSSGGYKSTRFPSSSTTFRRPTYSSSSSAK